MSKELKQALGEYADKIHQRWLNARDRQLELAEGLTKEHVAGVGEAYNNVENELRKLLKEDEDLAKANVSRLRIRRLNDGS